MSQLRDAYRPREPVAFAVPHEGFAPTAFDTPRCALQSWRGGKTPATSLRVQDYYERRMHDGAEVRFMIGGDVVGPMGPDLVPVEPALVSKFIQDHGAERALRLDEVTLEVLSAK